MKSRPDAIDAAVALWLTWAVGIAAVWTAPFEAFRAPWPAPRPGLRLRPSP